MLVISFALTFLLKFSNIKKFLLQTRMNIILEKIKKGIAKCIKIGIAKEGVA